MICQTALSYMLTLSLEHVKLNMTKKIKEKESEVQEK